MSTAFWCQTRIADSNSTKAVHLLAGTHNKTGCVAAIRVSN